VSHILVVEDEAHLADGLRFNLEAEGYSARIAADGESALALLNGQERFDAVVLDVMLPGIDGFIVAATLRKAKNYVPVLMLTARGRPEDVLKGFAAGADDYLPKPFELRIFLARLQGLLRRSAWLRSDAAAEPSGDETLGANGEAAAADGESSANDGELFSLGDRTIDFGALELRSPETTIHLTLMEAKLLRKLIHSQGRTVSRKSILEDVWGLREDTDTRAIDNFIVRLRRYIEDDPAKPKHVLTVRGVGYRFVT
jgi:two-component system alkaline phosphatase synthesis response regulator PhoP